MKNNYDIKHNPNFLSSEEIAKHKNFHALLEKYSAQEGETSTGDPSTATNTAQLFLKYIVGGGLALVVAIGLYYMLHHSKPPTPETLAFLQPPLNLDILYEEVSINVQEGDTLQLSSAAQLVIPPNSLLDNNDDVIEGEIVLLYRELNTPEAQLLAGISEPLAPAQHWQNHHILELKTKSEDKILNIASAKPLEFIRNNTTGITSATARNYYNKVWSTKKISVQKKEAGDVDVLEENLKKKLQELEKEFPKPIKPIKPANIGQDMQPFDVDIQESEFPELVHYAKIIWVAPRADLKDEWFDIEWDNMRVVRKGALNYEFLFEKGNQQVSVAALPQIPYSQQAMKDYEQEFLQYKKTLQQRQKQIQEALALWKTEQKKENPTRCDRLFINQLGLWMLGTEVPVNDMPTVNLTFKAKENRVVDIQEVFVKNEQRGIYYNLPSSDHYKIELEHSTLWVLDTRKQLWKMIKNNDNQVILERISASQLLNEVKGLAN